MRTLKARDIALAAVLTAFSVTFIYLAGVLPTGQLGFLGVASLFGIAAVVELGIPGGAMVFVSSAILGFIMTPSKLLAGLYTVFFGWYPVMKALAERVKRRGVEWIIKLAAFNAALIVANMFVKAAFFDFGWVVYPIGNAVFILFDIGVSRAIRFYMARIHPKIHKK